VLPLSIVSLFVGPLLYHWLRQGGFIARAFDTLIVAILLVLLVFLLIPESWAELGGGSVALMLVGYLVPGLLERLIKRAAETLHRVSLVVALVGLALHATLDGAGLAGGLLHRPEHLALAITVHRLSVGLILWMLVQPIFGKRVALAVLGLLALATVGGYLLSEYILGIRSEVAMPVIQALIIGAIGHSLVHRDHSRRHKGR